MKNFKEHLRQDYSQLPIPVSLPLVKELTIPALVKQCLDTIVKIAHKPLESVLSDIISHYVENDFVERDEDCTDRTGIIYRIWHKKTGKSYVGQTRNALEKRIRTHLTGRGHPGPLREAVKEEGKDAFHYGCLERDILLSELNAREAFYIAKIKYLKPNGYNISSMA